MASRVSATAKMRAPTGISRPRQAVGIAGTVEMFLMAKDDLGCAGEEGDLAQHLIAARAVFAHKLALLFRELAGLAQNLVGDGHLADVVQEGAAGNDLDLFRRNAHGARQGNGIGSDALGVAFGLRILEVEGVAQRLEGHVVGVLEILHGVAQHFSAGADHFFEALVVALGFLKGAAVVDAPAPQC